MEPYSTCCDEYAKACESGSDNEAWGRLVLNYGGKETIGSDLAPIKFCPWCAAPKNKENEHGK